jgi:hypothetical protein
MALHRYDGYDVNQDGNGVAWLVVEPRRGEDDAVGLLDRAARALARDPDEAAWLLDGALRRLLAVWLRRQGLDGLEASAPEQALAAIGRLDDDMAMRVRLALRAPNAGARLAACRGLLAAIGISCAMGDGAADGVASAEAPALRLEGR